MRTAEFDEYYICVRKIITLAGNHVKEILLKLNLPNHRSILTDSKVTPTKHGRMTKPYSSPRFIANGFISGIYKEGHEGTDIKKRTKIKTKPDKTKHGIEKSAREIRRPMGCLAGFLSGPARNPVIGIGKPALYLKA
ncbi:hypothetical protein Tco_1194994 [Tanacetum coccineum]